MARGRYAALTKTQGPAQSGAFYGVGGLALPFLPIRTEADEFYRKLDWRSAKEEST